MQHRLVAAVAEGAEQRALLARRLGQQRQRLVGVGGDDDVIEDVAAPCALDDDRLAAGPLDARDARPRRMRSAKGASGARHRPGCRR